AMIAAIEKADQPFRYARAIVALNDPAAELPLTLKAAPTPTEAKVALQQLQAILASHHGEDWADRLAAGPFGATSTDAVAKVETFDTATTSFLAARTARTGAASALYAVLLAFKDMLRHGTGETASGASED